MRREPGFNYDLEGKGFYESITSLLLKDELAGAGCGE